MSAIHEDCQISVIIPTLNRPDLLREAIGSVARQGLSRIETIVVDDGSRLPVDKSTLRHAFGTSRLRVLRNERSRGLAWARNQGAVAALGQYIAHLDDDDLFAAEALGECVGLLESDTSVDLIFVIMRGFGAHEEHFNRVQREGVERVIEQGGGKERPILVTAPRILCRHGAIGDLR